jgi:acetyl esterase/lipase
LLIHVGGNETLLDDSVRFAGKAGAAQTRVRLDIWPRMIHEWHIWHSVLDEADAALEEGVMFLRAHLGIDAHPASADVLATS